MSINSEQIIILIIICVIFFVAIIIGASKLNKWNEKREEKLYEEMQELKKKSKK